MGSFNITIVPEGSDLNLPVLVDYKTEYVVNLNSLKVTALADNGDIERSYVLYDSVVREIKKIS